MIDLFVLGPETVVYSAQDMHELQQEWQEMHQLELLDVQRWMQVQLDAQMARYWRQGNQSSAVYPPAGAMPMGQPGLSVATPTFVPGQGPVDMHVALYNSTPRVSDQMQPMGLDSRSADRTESVNVYASFQQEKPSQHSSYGDHQIADPMARIGPEE